MNIIKIGIFLPQKNRENDHGSIHKPLSNRMPNQEIQTLISLIVNSGKFELFEINNFEELIIFNNSVFHESTNLSNALDVLFWFGEIGRGEQNYSLDILKVISQAVTVIPNPYSFEIGLDKYLSHLTLKSQGVNVADFVLITNKNFHLARPILDEWGYGLLKPRKGGFGKGVTLIDSFSMLRDVVEYIESINGLTNEGMLLERYYDNSLDKFVSVTLVDGEIMYGYRKRPSKVTDLGNGLQKVYDANEIGGEVDICDVLPAHEIQALRANDAIGSEVIGFDMVWHNGQPIIVDENTFPGIYVDLFKQKGISLAEKMYHLILRRVYSKFDVLY
ncbi:MAG: hypothetical protein AAGD25_09475 [Cyanobacteria bacterium P01_F01_bin.150]